VNREATERFAAFVASLGASGFAAVLNFGPSDQCVILLNNFPARLGADILGSVAGQLDEAVPDRLN
jgi:hypothetical protein